MASDTRERQRRRKITLACEPCRERKSRCDGRKPICSTCEHRALGLEQCIYKVGNARTASSDEYTKALHERIRQLERACAQHGVDVDAAGAGRAGGGQPHLPASAPGSASASRVHSPSMLAVVDRRLVEPPPSRTTASSVTSPESMNPENATGVTAMGAVLSEEDLDAVGAAASFYGRSSAASFLQEAASSLRQRQAMAGAAPSSSGVHAQPAGLAAAAAAPPPPALKFTDVDRFALPPRALADHLLQRFFGRVFYLYPFFDRAAFEHAYRSLWQSDAERASAANTEAAQLFEGLGLGSIEAGADTIVFHCALNAVFALGCCFSDLPGAERTAALDVFGNRSKSFVGLDLIEENNLGVVQALLVVSLVLQGTPFPNRCWNAVGMACRVAQGLGLHTEEASPSRRPRSELERQTRRRTWHGCVVLDVLVSMTFGRPPMTSSLSIAPETLSGGGGAPTAPADPETLKLAFYRESVKLSVVLEGILQRIYQPWLTRDASSTPTATAAAVTAASSALQIHHNLDTVVEIQGQLDHFERSVTPFLSWTAPAALPDAVAADDRHIMEINRNVLHARFIYMQLILYRPILSQLAGPDAAATTASSHGPSAPAQSLLSRDGLRYSFALECGKSCVEAAKRLIVLVHDIYLTDATDVWWWNGLYACAAGLVLIVARSCPALWRALDQAEIAALWDQCQSVLQNQASFSASARKSLDLLLKVNEHVLLKQAAGEIESQGLAPAPDDHDAAALAGAQRQQLQGHLDLMAQLDPGAPTLLEDTYTMGPLFTWDQNFDFMYTTP